MKGTLPKLVLKFVANVVENKNLLK